MFLKFKKTEISIDWTLVKLSFRDFQIFKEIANHNIELMKSRVEQVQQYDSEEISSEDLNDSSDEDSDYSGSQDSEGNDESFPSQ